MVSKNGHVPTRVQGTIPGAGPCGWYLASPGRLRVQPGTVLVGKYLLHLDRW